MKRRWTAALLALLLTAALLPGTAHAAQADHSAGARLTGTDRVVYDILRAEVAKIADGARTSTTIRIPDQAALSWTLEELGMSGGSAENVLAKLEQKFSESVHMSRVFFALSADCPYELYWASNRFSWGFSSVRQGNQASIKNFTVYLQAAQAYQGDDSTNVSAARVSAAKQAAQTAKAIVAKYQDCSDFEKLAAYRDEICRLTSYDMDAYLNDSPYGDPWQLVYVFDGDPDTSVVCEGYAKAFKYLCDLSDFRGDVTCYTASGTMNGGSHMWNVVRMGDGRNYLVDVTNCDNGMIGSDGKLFLSGATGSNGGQTYTVSKEYCHAVYTYGANQADLFTDGYPAISGGDYVDRPPVTITIDPPQFTQPPEPTGNGSAQTFTDVSADAYYADSVAWAVEEEITNGTSTTTFSPGLPCTHSQILTFLWRAAGEPPATGSAPDGVRDSDYFYDAVRWAAGLGMLSEDFDPRASCARADAVRYIWSAFDKPSATASSFTDVASGAVYAQAVDWALDKGVTTGTTATTFDPGGICSRGQIVTFLYRAYH